MLTWFLSRIGYEVIAVDLYADSDTKAMARESVKLSGLNLKNIRHSVESLKRRYRLTDVIYGSGFESYPESLIFLQNELRIIGNSPAVFNAVQDKRFFFQRLDELRINYPAVSYTCPLNHSQWLVKPYHGEGGIGVRRYSSNLRIDSQSVYWQRYIVGDTLSVLFVSTQESVRIVGFQRQLVYDKNAPHEFLFAGVVSYPNLSVEIKELIQGWVVRLALRLELRGLNSMDFIVSGRQCYVLEINARPSSSMQLYGHDLITAHIESVTRGSLDVDVDAEVFCGYKIVYADSEIRIISDRWPKWVADRPSKGSIIGQGEPICSIIARANTYQQLLNRLQRKQIDIEQFLHTGV